MRFLILALLVCLPALAVMDTIGDPVPDYLESEFQLKLENQRHWYLYFSDKHGVNICILSPTDEQMKQFRKLYADARRTLGKLRKGSSDIGGKMTIGTGGTKSTVVFVASAQERPWVGIFVQQGIHKVEYTVGEFNRKDFERVLAITNQ